MSEKVKMREAYLVKTLGATVDPFREAVRQLVQAEEERNDLHAELAALRKLGLDVADIIPQLESSAEAGASIHYTVLGGWARRLSEALEAWEASKR